MWCRPAFRAAKLCSSVRGRVLTRSRLGTGYHRGRFSMAALCSILKHGITLRASHFTLEWRINIYGEYFWNIGCTTAAAQQENPQATGNRNFERKNNLDCLLTSHGNKKKRHPGTKTTPRTSGRTCNKLNFIWGRYKQQTVITNNKNKPNRQTIHCNFNSYAFTLACIVQFQTTRTNKHKKGSLSSHIAYVIKSKYSLVL